MGKMLLSVIFLMTAFSLTIDARADESALFKVFLKAYNSNIGMDKVIVQNRDLVPEEIETLLESSHNKKITPEMRAQNQYMAESMARAYNKVTGDISYLIEVKKDIFNSRLHTPVNTVDKKGVHVVDMPRATAQEKNVFRPDNIVIHEGEWVRWINNAGAAHIFASMPLIGKQIIFTPSIKPDQTWVQRFDEPGEYYYFCYIHNSMVGKITVLPKDKELLKEKKGAVGEEHEKWEKEHQQEEGNDEEEE